MKQQGLLASMPEHSVSVMHIVPPLLALLEAEEALELADDEELLVEDDDVEVLVEDDEVVPLDDDDDVVPLDDELEPPPAPPIPDDEELGGSNMVSSVPSAQLAEFPMTQASATPKKTMATFEFFFAAIN